MHRIVNLIKLILNKKLKLILKSLFQRMLVINLGKAAVKTTERLTENIVNSYSKCDANLEYLENEFKEIENIFNDIMRNLGLKQNPKYLAVNDNSKRTRLKLIETPQIPKK